VAEPASGRMWSAARGGGAMCDGQPLAATDVTDVAMTLLGTGFSYSARRRARQASFIGGLLPRVRDVRRSGSSALDVCAVAAGWLDAYVEHGTHWWDWAASALIAEEAGAVVRVPERLGHPAADDGLGPDTLLVAAPGVANCCRHAMLGDVHGLDLDPPQDGGAGSAGAVGQDAVEPAAIDDRGRHIAAVDDDGAAVTPVEAGEAADGADGVARQVELVERVDAEHARAMDGIANRVVLFEDEHRHLFGGEARRRAEAGRARADHQHVPLVR